MSASEDDAYAAPLRAALGHALDYLASLGERPVGAPADARQLRVRLDRALAEHGVPADRVIGELAGDTAGGLHASAGGRFFGWVIGGALPAALAADWLASAWDQNAHSYGHAPAAAIVEEVAGRWLRELLQLPPGASFAMVTGCQMAHVTCLAAARHALLARSGWDVEAHGLYGAPPIRIVAGEHAHGSIARALRLLGLGTAHCTQLPTDAEGRLPVQRLRAALESLPRGPTVVVLQAGDVNCGAFDAFDELIPVAREHAAWVHVDGAFGLWAAASPRYRHLLDGVAGADSWATDGHKWLNVPYDCGYAFVADAQSHAGAMAHRAAYITYSSEARDQSDWNPEWSRRARGFASYAALRQLGRAGLGALIERCCDHARALVEGIGRLRGAEVLAAPRINQGLVRFRDPRPGATAAEHDRRTEAVIARINAGGAAYFTGTTWRGQRAMRVSVCNWRTTAADVERAIAGVAAALES